MDWPIFEGVPEAEVQRVLSIARRRTFRREEVVFHQDDPADTLHLIQKGRFAVRMQTRLGDSVTLAVLGPGEMFGELALLSDDARRSATVSALEAAETRSVHRIDFEKLQREHPQVDRVLIAVLAAQVRRLSGALVEALYLPAEKRVLRRLLDLRRVYGEEAEVPLKQEELASLAGTSRATVNKVLREEEERGSVRLGRARVAVLDAEAVERRAGTQAR